MTRLAWLWWLAISVAIIAAAMLLRFEPPDQIVLPVLDIPLPQSCWTRKYLGFSCPGCGLTRSFVLAGHGRIAEAFRMHPVGSLVFFLLVLQVPFRIYQGWQFFAENPTTRPPRANHSSRLESGIVEVWLLALATATAFAWWAVKGLFG